MPAAPSSSLIHPCTDGLSSLRWCFPKEHRSTLPSYKVQHRNQENLTSCVGRELGDNLYRLPITSILAGRRSECHIVKTVSGAPELRGKRNVHPQSQSRRKLV